MLNLKAGARIYFIAICGTGMSALAGLFKEKGFVVAGSDLNAYPPVGPLLQSLGIPVCIGYELKDIQDFKPDYVVIGNFVNKANPQAVWVLESKIPYGSFPSTLENFFLEKTNNYVVLGTHGKTTTTSTIAHLLRSADRDPSFLVGGVAINFQKSFHVGKGSDFVIEGDEYDTAFFDKESKFLHYRPTVGVFMAMEYDHADIFPTNEAMEKMFRKFLHLIPARGALFYSGDWKRIIDIVGEEKPKGRIESFGFEASNIHPIKNFKEGVSGLSFELDGTRFENEFMNGKFNAENFAGAVLAARFAGLSDSEIQKGIASFEGVKRRQEVKAKVGESLVIDDFAHHPTAVTKVLAGIKNRYPKHTLVVFFEPRSNTSRRAVLQSEFEKAFLLADETLIAPVFKEEAIPENDRLNLDAIAAVHQKAGKSMHIRLSIDRMIEKAQALFHKKSPCVFLILSNGAFDGLHEKLISALKT